MTEAKVQVEAWKEVTARLDIDIVVVSIRDGSQRIRESRCERRLSKRVRQESEWALAESGKKR